jgi:hypothetical protein
MERNDLSGKIKRVKNHIVLLVILILVPPLSGLLYIFSFGVDVPNWDEWMNIPVIEKAFNGTLSAGDLLSQHNEHRILFPRLIFIIFAKTVHFNVKYLQYFSWILCVASLLIIYALFIKKFGFSKTSLLIFIPVSWLIFCFGQYENILWGWQVGIYLCIFCVLLSLYSLNNAAGSAWWFVLAIISGIVSSYSFFNGLLVWETGLLFLLISRFPKKNLIVIWSVTGLGITASYFFGWVFKRNNWQPDIYSVLQSPAGGVKFFLANLGSPISFDPTIAVLSGFLLLLLVIITCFALQKNNVFEDNSLWLSMLFFSLASSVMITIGRAGFGVHQAMSSRYTTFVIIGIIGLFFITVNLYFRFGRLNKKYLILLVLLTCLIVAGLVMNNYDGIRKGAAAHEYQEQNGKILLYHDVFQKEELGKLFRDVNLVRQGTGFLEKEHLTVFFSRNSRYPLKNFTIERVHPGQSMVYFTNSINGVSKFVIFEHPVPENVSVIKSEALFVRPEDHLMFSIALDPGSWSADKGDGVTFELYATSANSTDLIFSRYIDPKHTIPERKWNDFDIDLSSYSGREVTFIFSTLPGPANNTLWDWAWWGDPRIENDPDL